MDSEGWIDIAMIASFNRVKSLTPEFNMVREVMTLSSLLEVHDNKVRLANGHSSKWVLPDAKLSTINFASSFDGLSNNGDAEREPKQNELQPKFGPRDVENALMRSVAPSSSASALNGDESMEKTNTPATSLSGDCKEEEEEQGEVVLLGDGQVKAKGERGDAR